MRAADEGNGGRSKVKGRNANPAGWKQAEGKSERALHFHINIYCRGGIFYIHAITILHNINLPNIPIYTDAVSLSEQQP